MCYKIILGRMWKFMWTTSSSKVKERSNMPKTWNRYLTHWINTRSNLTRTSMCSEWRQKNSWGSWFHTEALKRIRRGWKPSWIWKLPKPWMSFRNSMGESQHSVDSSHILPKSVYRYFEPWKISKNLNGMTTANQPSKRSRSSSLHRRYLADLS